MSERIETVAVDEGADENLQAPTQPEMSAETPQADAVEQEEVGGELEEPVAQVQSEPEAESLEPQAEATPDVPDHSADEPVAEAADTASVGDSDSEADLEGDSSDDKKVVRTLAVGQLVTGTVKRIADFGAFIDIGVGRDGLIHISELSVRRVGKVTDMLQEGQEVEAWIKKLDRDRNRISLTLIDPDTKTIRDLQKGDVVKGRVTRLLPYGAFVDIGIGRDALLHVREMAEGFVAKPEDVVSVDEELEARVIDLSRRRSRVDLSLKGLRPEPEAAVPHQSEAAAAVEEPEVEEVDDAFEDVEVLSPMELAFKRAMEAEGIELPERKKGKRNRRGNNRDLQDEIIARTLTDGRR